MSNEKEKVINVKLDADTKRKFEILAFIKDSKLQDLCAELIKAAIKENSDKIDAVEKLKD